MIVDEELASLELSGVHGVKEHSLATFLAQILSVEFRCHMAPHLGALIKPVSRASDIVLIDAAHLYVGNVSILGQIHPIRLIQLGADEEVQVVNLVIFTHESGCNVLALV